MTLKKNQNKCKRIKHPTLVLCLMDIFWLAMGQNQHHSSFHASLPLPALSQAATPWCIPTTTITINITIADNPCHGTLPPHVGVAEDPSDTSRAAVLPCRGRVIAVCVASDCVVVSSLSCHGVHGCTCIHTSANRFRNDFHDLVSQTAFVSHFKPCSNTSASCSLALVHGMV